MIYLKLCEHGTLYLNYLSTTKKMLEDVLQDLDQSCDATSFSDQVYEQEAVNLML